MRITILRNVESKKHKLKSILHHIVIQNCNTQIIEASIHFLKYSNKWSAHIKAISNQQQIEDV